MPVNIDKELLLKLLPIALLILAVFFSYFIAKSLAPKNYPIHTVNEFVLNVSGGFDLEKMKELSKLNVEGFKEMLFSYPEETKETYTKDVKDLNDSEIEIHLTMILESNDKKLCRINGKLLRENDSIDGILVGKITDLGVYIETKKGVFFIRNGEKKII